MKKLVLVSTFGLVLTVGPGLASAQTASPSGDPAILAMKLEEANFLLDQRRSQLEEMQRTNAMLLNQAQKTADYWAAYVKRLTPEAAMNPAKETTAKP